MQTGAKFLTEREREREIKILKKVLNDSEIKCRTLNSEREKHYYRDTEKLLGEKLNQKEKQGDHSFLEIYREIGIKCQTLNSERARY